MCRMAGRVIHVIAWCILFAPIESEVHISGCFQRKIFQEVPLTINVTDDAVITILLRILVKLHLCYWIVHVRLYIGRRMIERT